MKFAKALLTAGVLALSIGVMHAGSASAFYGLDINDLPRDGNVTVPGDYPIRVRKKNTVLLSGLNDGLTLNLVNTNSRSAVVRISAPDEKRSRPIKINNGVPTTYNVKSSKEVTVLVTDGDVIITSINPLKVQHPNQESATKPAKRK
jgi:hypothetical protein